MKRRQLKNIQLFQHPNITFKNCTNIQRSKRHWDVMEHDHDDSTHMRIGQIM